MLKNGKHNVWILLLFLVGCTQVKQIINKTSPREDFTIALKNSPINEKRFVQEWKSAWENARTQPVDIDLPYHEKGRFFPSDITASAFHFVVNQGEKVTVTISSSVNLFAELFNREETEKPLVYLKQDETSFTHTIKSSGSYLLVLQPELLGSGSYELTIQNTGSLAFPVLGKDSYSIQSFWGAMREGGKRSHEGVDIFAGKGTPVLAVAPGTAHAGTNNLGGNVIWQRSNDGRNFYYAHLDSQTVSYGQVNTGDTIGFVGNSGNARSTSPHLHFGIYMRGRGAVDPFPFIDNVHPEIPEINLDTAWNESLARISAPKANMRYSPSTEFDPDTSLLQNTVVKLNAATKDWYRISLPDGTGGFVYHTLIDSLEESTHKLPDSTYVAKLNPWARHLRDSILITGRPEIYGSFDNRLLVKASGRYFWVMNPEFVEQ